MRAVGETAEDTGVESEPLSLGPHQRHIRLRLESHLMSVYFLRMPFLSMALLPQVQNGRRTSGDGLETVRELVLTPFRRAFVNLAFALS